MEGLNFLFKKSFISWLIILIALSYFLFPYFPDISFEFRGKPFFITQILLVVALGSLGLKQLKEKKLYWPSLLSYLAVFSALLFLSTLINNGALFKVSFSLFSILAIVYLFSYLDKEYLRKFLKIFAWFTLVAAVLGIIQFYIGGFTYVARHFGYEDTTYFASGFANFPSLFALHLALAIPIFLALAVEKTKTRSFYLTAFYVSAAALFLTFSRGAWLGLMVALIFLFLKLSGQRKFLATHFLIAFIVVLSVLVLPLEKPFRETAKVKEYGMGQSTVQITQKTVDVGSDFSSRSRLAFYIAARDMVFQSPKTFSIGLGHQGFEKNWKFFRPDIENIDSRDVVNSHSSYLSAVTSSGIIGLSFFLVLLFLIFFRLMRTGKKNIIAYGFAGALIAIFVDSLFHDFLFTKYFGIFVGSALSLIRIYEPQDN